MNNIFYVYVYLNPLKPGKFRFGEYVFDFEPFYVGKGKGNRIKQHLTDAKHKKWHFHNTIRNIWANNTQPIIMKLKENISEIESWNIEKSLIENIGRYDLNKGPLTNMTDGGDGPANRIPWNKGLTSETSEKVKQYTIKGAITKTGKPVFKRRGIPLTEETKKKIAETCRKKTLEHNPFKGCKHSEETKQKMRDAWKVRKINESKEESQ
jgi:hypothetical protein